MIFAGASLSRGCDRDAEVDRYRASEIFIKGYHPSSRVPYRPSFYIESSYLFVARYW